MSDFAFNNYCIHCDKLCPTNSVYCSEECKSIEYQQSSILLNNNYTATSFEQYSSLHQHNNESQYHQHNNPVSSEDTASNTNEYASNDMVSPLLTPALYLQLQSVSSPLMLASHVDVETKDDRHDLNYFDLNYSVKSNINYTSNTTSNELLNSTSHNYRKWLTAL